ncbi:VC2046/SO_2500 family protein [Shewanella intestini]|uniref:QueD-like protein n=1 Tax=Shewanella intestini TaxID=2017544 RepID=A0ABS5HZS6_9GAMM|nr:MULTISPECIES: VC2046/SO_2500 family protein [Shewanella]MBR9727257.1 queD-like protein [Shewanella intestini]MRG36059.1 queD-like protein [Shewanella sp. XMDDZSB0408]
MQSAFPLINELQLGSRLNQDIREDRRGDFGLILAMLSEDARDMAQFSVEAHLSADEKLTKQLQLPPAKPLLHDLSQAQEVVDHAQAFQTHGQAQFNLEQALRPEPVVIRGMYDQDMQLCLSNCSQLAMLKHANTDIEPDQLGISFLDELEMQRTMANTINIAA